MCGLFTLAHVLACLIIDIKDSGIPFELLHVTYISLFLLIILFCYLFLFVYDITLTSVIFSVNRITGRLTLFVHYIFLFNILLVCNSVLMDVSVQIYFYAKGNNCVFPCPLARKKHEIEHPCCLSFNR